MVVDQEEEIGREKERERCLGGGWVDTAELDMLWGVVRFLSIYGLGL